MSQHDTSWSDAAEQFRLLGSGLKDHYKAGAEVESSSSSEDADGRPDNSGVHSAIAGVEAALRAPEVQDDARYAAGLTLEALGGSISKLGSNISTHRRTSDDPNEPGESLSPAPERQTNGDEGD